MATDVLLKLEKLEPLLQQTADEVVFMLEKRLESDGVLFHNISKRIKRKSSVLAKLERKQAQDLSAITDLAGVRVVCLFLSEIEKVGELIRKLFDVVSEDNKVESSEVSSFGYMSFHFVA